MYFFTIIFLLMQKKIVKKVECHVKIDINHKTSNLNVPIQVDVHMFSQKTFKNIDHDSTT